MNLIIKGAEEEIANELYRIFLIGTQDGIQSQRFKLFRYALGIKAVMYYDNGDLVIEKREKTEGSKDYVYVIK